MERRFHPKHLLAVFVVFFVFGDIFIILSNNNDDNKDDDDDDDDYEAIRSVVKRSVAASGNCSSVELKRLMAAWRMSRAVAVADFRGGWRNAFARTGPGLRGGRVDPLLEKLVNCSAFFVENELSISSLTGLCHAQCTANCADSDGDCVDLNCTQYQSESWATQCGEDDYECLENCSQNDTLSAEESLGPVPKKPTTLSLLQIKDTVVMVTWSPSEVTSPENNTVVYVTESMSLIQDWSVVSQSTENWTETTVGVCEVVAFRVAAVNQFGFDGYTNPVVRTEFPSPDVIIDANNETLSADKDFFYYKFMFYIPEDWEGAIPQYKFPRKQCPSLTPPYPQAEGFTKIDPRTYIFNAKIPTAGSYQCIYVVEIYLVSLCGVQGTSYTTNINLTSCEHIAGMSCPDTENPWNPESGIDNPRSSTTTTTTTTTATTTTLEDSFTSGRPAAPAAEGDAVVVYASVGVAVFVVVAFVLLFVGCFVHRRRNSMKSNAQTTIRLECPLHELKVNNILYTSPESYTEIIGRDEWEISRDLIVLGEVLGQGAFGQVRKAELQVKEDFLNSRHHLAKRANRFQSSKMTVAVKMLIGDDSDLHRSDFLREMELMRTIGYHDNVVSMIGCCTRDDPLSLVVEHVANGDLLNFLQSYRARYQLQRYDESSFDFLTSLDLMNFARQIALGMEFLSTKGFVHRDLAARNILVGEEKAAKIGDFGLTRYIYDDQVYVTNRGGKLPLKWMAVESIFDLTFTTASDVWSYGIVLYEIVTLGGTPYPTISHKDLLQELQKGYRMERPPANCTHELYRLMLSCWHSRPTNRPTFTELREQMEKMTDLLKNSSESVKRVVPIDESIIYEQSQRGENNNNSSSSSGRETYDSGINRSDNVNPISEISHDLTSDADKSRKLSDSPSLFNSIIDYRTFTDHDNRVLEDGTPVEY